MEAEACEARTDGSVIIPAVMFRRIVFTAGANVFRAAASFVTGVLLARWLGPSSFGDMAFLLAMFTGVKAFLDLGSTSAFFTFVSQQPRSRGFVLRFLAWLAAQCAVVCVLLAVLLPPAWLEIYFLGQPTLLVLCAFAAVFCQNTLWPVAQSIAEATRDTVLAQTLGIAIAALHLGVVVLLFAFDTLAIAAVLVATVVEYLAGFVLLARNYWRKAPQPAVSTPEPNLGAYAAYCLPLLPLLALGALQEVVDRWLLQQHGAQAQGVYAFGYQLASTVVVLTGAFTRVLWREIAESHHRSDPGRLQDIFLGVLNGVRLLTSVFAAFCAVFSTDLILATAGARYVSGAPVVTLLALYITVMASGQMYSTLLMATGNVATLGRVGVVLSVASMVLAYALLGGSASGATGSVAPATLLAAKMFAIELCAFGAYAVIARTNLQIHSKPYLHVVFLGGAAVLAGISRLAMNVLFPDVQHGLAAIGLAAALYAGACIAAAAVVLKPLGYDRSAMRRLFMNKAVGSR
jgi:O-antigen/teichoic acid export membrane protein